MRGSNDGGCCVLIAVLTVVAKLAIVGCTVFERAVFKPIMGRGFYKLCVRCGRTYLGDQCECQLEAA